MTYEREFHRPLPACRTLYPNCFAQRSDAAAADGKEPKRDGTSDDSSSSDSKDRPEEKGTKKRPKEKKKNKKKEKKEKKAEKIKNEKPGSKRGAIKGRRYGNEGVTTQVAAQPGAVILKDSRCFT